MSDWTFGGPWSPWPPYSYAYVVWNVKASGYDIHICIHTYFTHPEHDATTKLTYTQCIFICAQRAEAGKPFLAITRSDTHVRMHTYTHVHMHAQAQVMWLRMTTHANTFSGSIYLYSLWNAIIGVHRCVYVHAKWWLWVYVCHIQASYILYPSNTLKATGTLHLYTSANFTATKFGQEGYFKHYTLQGTSITSTGYR